jgi:hypothetical protein
MGFADSLWMISIRFNSKSHCIQLDALVSGLISMQPVQGEMERTIICLIQHYHDTLGRLKYVLFSADI